MKVQELFEEDGILEKMQLDLWNRFIQARPDNREEWYKNAFEMAGIPQPLDRWSQIRRRKFTDEMGGAHRQRISSIFQRRADTKYRERDRLWHSLEGPVTVLQVFDDYVIFAADCPRNINNSVFKERRPLYSVSRLDEVVAAVENK